MGYSLDQKSSQETDQTGKVASTFASAVSGQHSSIFNSIATGGSKASNTAGGDAAATATSGLPWYVWAGAVGVLAFVWWKKKKGKKK